MIRKFLSSFNYTRSVDYAKLVGFPIIGFGAFLAWPQVKLLSAAVVTFFLTAPVLALFVIGLGVFISLFSVKSEVTNRRR